MAVWSLPAPPSPSSRRSAVAEMAGGPRDADALAEAAYRAYGERIISEALQSGKYGMTLRGLYLTAYKAGIMAERTANRTERERDAAQTALARLLAALRDGYRHAGLPLEEWAHGREFTWGDPAQQHLYETLQAAAEALGAGED
jgi:hypothetical protein